MLSPLSTKAEVEADELNAGDAIKLTRPSGLSLDLSQSDMSSLA